MYITCHECNTVFRLDERRLKSTGSKVRCSQCGNIFTAFPPSAEMGTEPPILAAQDGPAFAAAPASNRTDAAPAADTPRAQQLEGIDMAALNAIIGSKPGDDRSDVAEKDDSDLDLDFDMDLDADDATAAAAGPESTSDDLDDADFEMDFEIDDGLDAGAPAAGEGAARDALAEDLAAHAKSESAREAESDDIGLTLSDLELEPDGGSDEQPAEEDLELDLEFNLDDHAADSPPEPPATAAPAATAPSLPTPGDVDLTDLGDLLGDGEPAPDSESPEEAELELDLEGEKAPSDAGAASAETLDLNGELGKMLDRLDETPSEEEVLEEIDLELDFEDPAPEPKKAENAKLPDDDFDLGDLTSALDQDDSGMNSDDSQIEELDLELDDGKEASEPAGEAIAEELDLGDLDNLLAESSKQEETEAGGPPDGGGTPDEELEDLEFELDAEFEDKPIAKKQETEIEPSLDEPELDLSDIEEMLEGDSLSVKSGGTPDAGVQDLGDLGELDLGEIEKAIDSEDDSLEPVFEDDNRELALAIDDEAAESPKSAGEDPMDLDLDIVATMAPIGQKADNEAVEDVPLSNDDDLTLDLEMENESPARKTMQPAAAAEDEFDLSDLGDLVEEPAVKSETIDTGDIELEFEIEDAPEPIIAQTAARVSRPFHDARVEKTEEVEETGHKKGVGRARPARKRGTSKLLVVFLVLAALGGGGYYGYEYVVTHDIQIPYLSQYINPKPLDPEGIANLSTLEINSKFIENEQSGRLFIITGKVRSGYPDTRGMVQIRGKLFSTGKILVKTEQVFAGSIIMDQDLAAKPIGEIKQELSKAPGPQVATARVAPGKTMPFMVVFSELPDNLDEFAIEVIRSQKVQ